MLKILVERRSKVLEQTDSKRLHLAFVVFDDAFCSVDELFVVDLCHALDDDLKNDLNIRLEVFDSQ